MEAGDRVSDHLGTPAAAPLTIGSPAPLFTARSTIGTRSLVDYRGRWLVLFSHPADFTPVCTSEFLGFARLFERFQAIRCDLLALSVDSLYAHVAWVRAIASEFGVEVPFPILEDPSMAIAGAYGMIHAGARDSSTVRATFVIDPDGIIRAMIWYPMSTGRSIEEILRLVTALQDERRRGGIDAGGLAAGRRGDRRLDARPQRRDRRGLRPLLVLPDPKVGERTMTPLQPVVRGFWDKRTSAVQYVAACPRTRRCAVIDPILDFDEKSGATATITADALLDYVASEGLTVDWILDTHPHADHFSAAQYLKAKTSAPTAIGARVPDVQALWREIYDWPELACDGSQWDRLFAAGDTFRVGEVEARVLFSPGHTLASITYLIGDAAFVHDTLFMPDSGTARCDFPGGSAARLYESIREILALPDVDARLHRPRLSPGWPRGPLGKHGRRAETYEHSFRRRADLRRLCRGARGARPLASDATADSARAAG